jgi:hypothetical protein
VCFVRGAAASKDGAPNEVAMAVMAPIRIVALGFLASCAALCQSPNVQTSTKTLPDAPSVQNESSQGTTNARQFQKVFDPVRLPAWELSNGVASAYPAAHFDLGHFDRQQPTPNTSQDYWAKRIFAPTPGQSNSNHISASESLIRRATYAAGSVLVTQDDAGRSRLNTSYLLRVLAVTAAHSAAARSSYNTYLRRQNSRPASDLGSTIGNDAGMKVFHEFKPGILQLLKSHEPKFVYAIEERVGNK